MELRLVSFFLLNEYVIYPTLFRNFAGRLELRSSLPSFQYPVILFGIDVERLVAVVHNVLRLSYGGHPLNIRHCRVARYHLMTATIGTCFNDKDGIRRWHILNFIT